MRKCFKACFIQNCNIENESATEEEINTLHELDSDELLANIKDLFEELLKFKRHNLSSNTTDLSKSNRELEKRVQKLEGEVRKHIANTNKIKVMLEEAKARIE